MQEKIKLSCPVVVEGRYDKQRVLSVAEGTVIQLDGFSVFNNKEKQALLRRLCGNGNIILLTDSDSAGGFIRAKLKGYLPAEKIIHVYAPKIEGKEKRKKTPSKEGVLGIEGLDTDVIYRLLKPFEGEITKKASLTKADLFGCGLLGGESSSAKRNALARALELPENMTPKAFLEAINLVCTEAEFRKALEKI